MVGAGAVLAAWFAGAATSGNREAVDVAPIKSSPIDNRGAELATEVARLHERLRPTAVPRQPGRNLFSFASRKTRAVAPIVAPSPPALSEATAVRPVPVPLKLSGIAEDRVPGGVVRTAIISGRGQLFLAKEGESVTDRYRVARISSEVVELTDLNDGSVLRLALK